MLQVHVIRSLVWVYSAGLLYVFSEFDDDVMSTIYMKKPILPPF